MSETIYSESFLGDYRNYRDPALDEDNSGDDLLLVFFKLFLLARTRFETTSVSSLMIKSEYSFSFNEHKSLKQDQLEIKAVMRFNMNKQIILILQYVNI